MKTARILLTAGLALALHTALGGQNYPYLHSTGQLTGLSGESGIDSPVTVNVIYDNCVHTPGYLADWGYSIVIEGLEKTVLFDAGTRPDIFKSNIEKTGIDASSVDLIVISHEHLDQAGGMAAFTKMRTGIPIILPHSFTRGFIENMDAAGYEPTLVSDAAVICKNLYTSGEFDFQIPEQCLVLDTRDGLVVMTGCSHPGIVGMLTEIKETFNKDIVSVFGGFHLMNKTRDEMEEIIAGMKSLGIKKCGATHCTGEMQIEMFREAFGDNYFGLGTGNVIEID